MRDDEIDKIIQRSYDLHFHIGPDILPRKYNVRELIQQEQGKIAGIVLKSHSFPTITGIIASGEGKSALKLFGSVTMNYFMGGFNPSAIYASSTMSKNFPIIVWFPTIHAENHLRHNYSNYEIPPEWVKDPEFKPRIKTELKAVRVTDWNNSLFDKCVRVLKMIKKMGCIMATGHLSWEETEILATEALKENIKVIITHPNQKDIAMPLRTQKDLAKKGAYIEHCYVMYLDRDNKDDYPLDEMADKINEVGADQCILSSDAGQMGNPGPSESLKEFVKLLLKEGITRSQFEKMLIKNPETILGIRGG
ncbi:MAG: hypothetical protein C4549_07800 [Deltaproteobacteria bacterium]|nr:MAG: hypothetical protein C4549_07800 [Deltaproteobacteria bacterium]